jgi:glycosyltransferase involved in cell wall biosynthesis
MSFPGGVAVVIPAKDRAAVLPRALASVAAQTVAPDEVIVVDDGSTDDGAEIAVRLGATLVQHDRPRGSGAARNSGILAATSRWIAFLDSDDEWFPRHLEYLAAHADGHVLLGSAGVDSNGKGVGNVSRQTMALTPRRCFVPSNPVVTSAALADRQTLLDAGLFRDFPRAQDVDMWARLLERGTGVVLPDPTVVYHVPVAPREADAVGRDRAGVQLVVDDLSGPQHPWMAGVGRWLEARHRWDDLRRALGEGRRGDAVRDAAWLGAHPTTWPPLAELLGVRAQARGAAWGQVLADYVAGREVRQP